MSGHTLAQALTMGHGIERPFLCHVHGDTNPSASVNMVKKKWFCLEVSERVLTADLRWVEIGTVRIGDRLVGFDENPVGRRRNWRTAVVEGVAEITKPCYRVTLENGDEIVSSEDHLWLTTRPSSSSYEWRRTDALRTRNGNFVSLCKVADTWGDERTWEKGYLAGAFDGEGSLISRTEERKQKLIFYQKNNEMFRTYKDCMDTMGFKTNDYLRKDGVWSSVLGYKGEIMRLLGSCRPERLLAKFDPEWLGEMHTISQPKIVSVEFVGEQKVMAVQTSTSTFVAEGYASHNCYTCGAHGGLSGDALLMEPNYREMAQRLAETAQRLDKRYSEGWLAQYTAGDVHPYWINRFGEDVAREFQLGYDVESDAVTYPLRDPRGDLMGVVRRPLATASGPKYLYPRVDVSRLLWGYTPDWRRTVVLVEGVMDAIALHTSGIEAFAIFGSRLSKHQQALIDRIDPIYVITAFDQDKAGWLAHKRVEEAFGHRAVIKAEWPSTWGKDVDEIGPAGREIVFGQNLPITVERVVCSTCGSTETTRSEANSSTSGLKPRRLLIRRTSA